MSICAHRLGDLANCYGCKCGEEVRDEQENEAQREGAGRRANDNGGGG